MDTCLGSSQIRKLKEKKEMHMWSLQILNKLLECGARCTYEMNPKNDEAGSEYEYHMRERGNLYVNPVFITNKLLGVYIYIYRKMWRQGNQPLSPISLTDIQERQIWCRAITTQILEILTTVIR